MPSGAKIVPQYAFKGVRVRLPGRISCMATCVGSPAESRVHGRKGLVAIDNK